MSHFVARLRRLLPYVLILAVFAIVSCGGGAPAAAQEWRVNKAKSSVTLQFSMDGQPVAGRFGTYKFEIRFDPEEPADGEITATIDASSISTGDTARDAVLYGPDWLNASAFPTIRLSSASIREKETPEYNLQADMTMRGVTKRIAVPLTIDDQGTAGKIYAEARLDPAAFGIRPSAGVAEMLLVLDLTATHLTN
jgi:polyisoprenoid-binding protein YceI